MSGWVGSPNAPMLCYEHRSAVLIKSIYIFTYSYHRPKKGNRLHLNRRGVGKSPDRVMMSFLVILIMHTMLMVVYSGGDADFVVLCHLEHIRSS